MEQRHGSTEFYKILDEMGELHNRKSHDYASDDNPFGNYLFAGTMAALFDYSPQDIGFCTRFAEKLYRLANLERTGKVAANESIDDTELDMCVIITLWMASRRHRRKVNNNINYECITCGEKYIGERHMLLIHLPTGIETRHFCNHIHKERYIEGMQILHEESGHGWNYNEETNTLENVI